MSSNLTPSFKLMGSSWRLYKKGFFSFISMYLWGLLGVVPLGIVAVIGAVLYKFANWQNVLFFVVFGILGLAALAWAIYYLTRAKIGWLVLIKNDFSDVRKAFKESRPYFWRYFWSSLVTGLIVFALFFFLIVPSIVAAVFYAFASVVIIFEEKRTFSSIERSYDLVKNNWWPVFGRIALLALFAIIISSILNIPEPHLIGRAHNLYVSLINVFWALVGPYFLVFNYMLYLDVKKNGESK